MIIHVFYLNVVVKSLVQSIDTDSQNIFKIPSWERAEKLTEGEGTRLIPRIFK